jgi:hypothetical protein
VKLILTHVIAVLSWSSVLEYIRNLQKPNGRQKNIENLDHESGVGEKEIVVDNVGEKADIISHDLDYIDEDSSEVQLQVKY